MATTIITKAHDTKITFTHEPTIDGIRVPLADMAGCTLKFLMGSDTKTVSQTATISPDPIDSSLALFSYDPDPLDVDTVGKYQQEWEVTYPGPSAKLLTFPNNGYNIVKIIADKG